MALSWHRWFSNYEHDWKLEIWHIEKALIDNENLFSSVKQILNELYSNESQAIFITIYFAMRVCNVSYGKLGYPDAISDVI